MSETNETADKTLRTSAKKPLSLKRTVESGHVRQNFSHGRSNVVVVEKKRKRTISPTGVEIEEAPAQPQPPAAAPAAATGAVAPAPVQARPAPVAPRPAPPSAQRRDAQRPRTLSNSELEARQRALVQARERSEVEARQRAELEARQKAEAEVLARRRAEEEAERLRQQELNGPPAGAQQAAAQPAAGQPASAGAAPQARPGTGTAAARPATPAAARPAGGAPAPVGRGPDTKPDARRPETVVKRPTTTRKPSDEEEEETTVRRVDPRGGIKKVKVERPAPKAGDERQRAKLTINNFDREAQERSLASLRRKREREKLRAMGVQQPREKIVREVIIPEVITIQELSNRMAERGVDIIKYLMKQGGMHKINDVIDADSAELIVQEFGHKPRRVSEADVEEGFIGAKDEDHESLKSRAPVVTIMGHVDHGKTSLLDAIRKTTVASGEAGGITQHIGAYQVTTADGSKITFIDTPGHEAFTAMRARGAKVTDIVILVVAADDGVMPQTVEAINHAKAANVPMIVAVNKIDKPGADPKRVATELLQHEIVVESLSGETLDVPVSAVKGTNLDRLLEAILLQSEILDLKANPERSAEGFVIEAKLERGRGPVGTLLVQRGSLKVGDIVVAGAAWGRVRALIDDTGKNIDTAGPSVPVEVLGFDGAPEAGDQFAVVENEGRARELTQYRTRKRRETLGTAGTARTLEQMMQQIKEAGKKEFTLLVKGDVQGSVEAITGALKKLGTDEVEARVVHAGVGGITESDVALAATSGAVIMGFNVRANVQAKQAAEAQHVEIRYHNIIYGLVDEVKAAMSGLLAPTRKEVFLGYATIKQVFNISKVGKIAGCQVTEGKVERGAKVRLLRDNVVIHEGTLSVLKRFKDEVREVPAGQECGMAFANYQDIRENDQIECFQVQIIQRSL